MKLVLGKWATDRVQLGRSPEHVAPEAISYLYKRLGGHGGIILLGPTAASAWLTTLPHGLGHLHPRRPADRHPNRITIRYTPGAPHRVNAR